MEYYLVHSRTKGSKNGVRRYQNPDGTGTPLGLERRRDEYKRSKGLNTYVAGKVAARELRNEAKRTIVVNDEAIRVIPKERGSSSINANELAKGINSTKDVVNNARSERANSKRAKEKISALEDAKNMTDEELRERLKRLNLENNYVNAISQQSVSNGSDTVDKILFYTGAILGIAGSAVGIYASLRGK